MNEEQATLTAVKAAADYAKAHAISIGHIAAADNEMARRNASRRRAYRKAHPKKTGRKITQKEYRAVLADAKEQGDEALIAAAKEKLNPLTTRHRLYTFTCMAGLANNWRYTLADEPTPLKEYFEAGTDRLAALYGLLGFLYCCYRVSAEGDFLRGYIRFKEPVMETKLVNLYPSIDFTGTKHRDDLDLWLADLTIPCGKFYFSGVKPKRL